ncbi:kinase D-interacting substrate of 220 kDa B-like isoform X2 [Dendronephthya gigantea]|nr:kinase D-interacting substrate of 220 kDa B-like isoform X2 [Dendronephthya gigantea]XP_028400265.1 kinase D-interacting substrate of 220 kDa B-like isoform X2 [Dendronephthya gigantea]
MSIRLTRSISSVLLFDLIDDDDVNTLVCHLDQQPELINIRDEAAQTLLIAAAQCGSLKILRELLKRNPLIVNETDLDETTALIAASKGNHEQCAIELFKNGADLSLTDKDGWGAVTWAAYRGHSNIVRHLLQWDASPNEAGQHGMNPLIWAAGRGHTTVVEELLNAGANPDSYDKYGTSALVWAARKGHIDVMKALLEKNADVNKPGSNGWTPLIMAVKGGFEQAVTVLLEKGADVNYLDQNNNSALVWAVKQGHTGIVRNLTNHGAFINIRDKEGLPLLITACKDGNVEIVRILLENYADIEAGDLAGKTALWYAVESDHTAVVKELLEFGAFTESRRKDGETPLLLAVKKRHTEITSLLLEKNADLSVSNKKGDTALHIAVRSRYRRIAEIIIKDPRSARLLYQTNRAGETPYRIDQRHKKSILKPVLGMAEDDKRQTEELLGHNVYATSLAELLCEPSLELPLTVGVYSRWGSSKIHFFKRLQQEMQEITQQAIRPRLRFTCFGVLSCLFFCILIGIGFCSLFSWIVGVAVGCSSFILSQLVFFLMLLYDNRLYNDTESSWVSQYFCRFSNYFYLLYLVVFCAPPTVTFMRTSLPVHYAFADFSKLTRSSSEATALVSMVETLNEVIEGNFGCIVSRLYRVLRPPMVEYVGLKHSEPQFKKCCCCIPKLIIFFFVLMCGAVALVLYTEVGSDSGSLVAGLQISGACVVGISMIIQATTFCSVVYSLLFSPKRRVSIVATQLGLKEEGFIHALKQEVELLTEIVLALDGFKKIQTRIILFLDGLENSEQQKVLHLVDSINLLFTDPDAPFISVIAIDPRVMVRAIEQNFSNVLQDSHITALDYLKNIIHLPVFLPEPKTNFSGNLPDALRLSVEQLLRHRKTSGFDLEWEGESLELSPCSAREHSKSNGLLCNRHSTVLTLDDGGIGGCRLNRSIADIHGEKHEETPDMTHVLAENETLTPLGIQRLIHTTSLSGRLLRAKGLNFQWNALASWVSLVDSWPYRVSWLVLIMEEFMNVLPDNLPLKILFTTTQTWLPNSSGYEYAMDNDAMYFESYLGNHFPVLKVEDVRKFLAATVNLDPAIRNQLSQGLQAPSNNTLNNVDIVGNGGDGGSSDSMGFIGLNEEGVCVKLSQIDGITLTMVPSYQTTVRENHINGRVLFECDMIELRDVMEMNFGDWQLFRAWIMRHRATLHSAHQNDSSCSPWQSGKIDRGRNASGDTYVEMGNLSCVKSPEQKSGEDERGSGSQSGNKKSAGSRGAVNVSSIPKIVLDPGSSVPSIPDCEQDGSTNVSEEKTEAGTSENADDPSNEDDEQVKVISSTQMREIYAITPPASFTDSSDDNDDGDGCSETSPLVRNNPSSFESTSSTEQPESVSVEKTSRETRPLLSRQPEIDQASQSSKDANVNSFDQEERARVNLSDFPGAKVPTTLNLSENDDELESQRVTPILFTLSPTTKGNNQIVSVIASREMPAAFSRPPSIPNSPCARKPRSPRSPKSPRSFRSMFGLRHSSDKGNPNDKHVHDLSPSNGDISVPNDSLENCYDKTVKENSFPEANKDYALTRSEMQMNCEEMRNGNDTNSECVFESDGKAVYSNCIDTPSEASNSNDTSVNFNDANTVEGALIVFHSEPLPPRVPILSHRFSEHDSLGEMVSNKNDSLEEATNNSDKGYESVDNSPYVENEGRESGVSRSLNANASVASNGISELAQNGISDKIEQSKLEDITVIDNESPEPKRSVWVPLHDSKLSLGRKMDTSITTNHPECNMFSQTAV